MRQEDITAKPQREINTFPIIKKTEDQVSTVSHCGTRMVRRRRQREYDI